MTYFKSPDRTIPAAALRRAYAVPKDQPDRFAELLERLRQREDQDARSATE